MILEAFIIVQLIVCNADVSHIDTDLQEDGYHYRQPSSPFSSNNKVDATLNRDGLEYVSEDAKPFQRNPMSIMKSQIQPEYLPPVEIQRDLQTIPSQKPALRDREHSLSHGSSLPSQPSDSYPTAFPSQSSQTLAPIFSPKTERTRQKAPSEPSLIEQSHSINPSPIPNSSAIPEREYLPPDENEISIAQEQGQIYPAWQPAVITIKTPTSSNPEMKYLSPTRQSTYSAAEMTTTKKEPTIQNDQVDYMEAKELRPSAKPMFMTPQYTYPEEQSPFSDPLMQPTNSALEPTSRNPSLEPIKPDPAHELGPDGYKYKIPSQSFKY